MKPDTPEALTRRRRTAAKAKAERQRAITLSAPLKDPPPNELVNAYAAAAHAARERAAAATNRDARKNHLVEAKRLDIETDKARTKQLEEHWRNHAITESAVLAQGRGETLEVAQTEVVDWARDQDGVRILDSKGSPTLNTDKATTFRRKSGLEWLLDAGRLTAEQYRVGQQFAGICAAAHQAQQPARAEGGGGGGSRSSPPEITQAWRLNAIEAKTKADAAVLRPFGEAGGRALLLLLEAVCYQGRTARDIADGSRQTTVRVEERLIMGLAILRHHFMSKVTPTHRTREVRHG